MKPLSLALAVLLFVVQLAAAQAPRIEIIADPMRPDLNGRVFEYTSSDGSVALSGIAINSAPLIVWREGLGFTELPLPANSITHGSPSSALTDDGRFVWWGLDFQNGGPVQDNRPARWTVAAPALPFIPSFPPVCDGFACSPVLGLSSGTGMAGSAYSPGEFACGSWDAFVSDASGSTTQTKVAATQLSSFASASGDRVIYLRDDDPFGFGRDEFRDLVIGPPTGPYEIHPFESVIGTTHEELGLLRHRTIKIKFCADGETVFVGPFVPLPSSERPIYRWSLINGFERLDPGPLVRLFFETYSDSASPNGKFIVGRGAMGMEDTAEHGFYWSEENGFIDLRQHLVDNGVDVSDFMHIQPTAVTNDGSIVFATGIRAPGANPASLPLRIVMRDLTADSDGDGLPDEWEREGGGIDVDRDGEVEYSLCDLGARPDHKDLFLEIDSTRANSLSELSSIMLTAAFRFSPVENPDEITGIILHIDDSETGIPADEVIDGGADAWPPSMAAFKAAHFMSEAERMSPHAAKLREAKLRFVRYAVIFDEHSEGLPGIAKAINTNDFLVFTEPGKASFADDFDTYIASTIMHEFGHTLDLGHGGGDDINAKPNYLSIMNYSLADRTRWNRSFWRLDYSGKKNGYNRRGRLR